MPTTKHVHREFKRRTTSSKEHVHHEQQDMECRTPSSEDAYMVQRDNFNVALKFYVDVVIAELRREMQKQGFWIDDLQSLGDGCAAFELHSATICGLHRIILDGWPSGDQDPAGLGVPEVISFKVAKYAGVRLSERSVGALNEKIIEATGKALNKCMEDAISHRVLPVLNNLLKTMPFPGFT
ncbi:hypothetical protein MTO96_012882 [Rhipicephalus appendiculatus]